MTIDKAIAVLFASEAFQEDARKNAKLRVDQRRHILGVLGQTAKLNLLQAYGYKIVILKEK